MYLSIPFSYGLTSAIIPSLFCMKISCNTLLHCNNTVIIKHMAIFFLGIVLYYTIILVLVWLEE